MDPKSRDTSSGGGGGDDEFTIARKRSRRVSFAETTAVHVFPRDEDFETPPDSKPSIDGSKTGNEYLGFQGDHSDSDDYKDSERGDGDEDDDEEDGDEEQEKFIRDMDSSSPGSAAGSVTSNDDDNFFGPVSTSFIKSGHLSEAGMLDDNNHDITLDSTAFSLHFQNVFPPDDRSANSAGSLRTPTGDSVPTDYHGFMVPKEFKQQAPRSMLSDGNLSRSAGESSNMSLIVDDLDQYDIYGKMSPTLEALLAEANKSMQTDSTVSGSVIRASQKFNDGLIVANEFSKEERLNDNTDATARDSCLESHLSGNNAISIISEHNANDIPYANKMVHPPLDASENEKILAVSPPKVNVYSKDVHETIQSNVAAANFQNIGMLSPPHRRLQNNLTVQSGQLHQECFQDQPSESKHRSDSSPSPMLALPASVNLDGQCGMQTPKSAEQYLWAPLGGSVSSLHGKRQQLFLHPADLLHTPDKEEPLSSLKMKLVQHGERISAIKIPKFTISRSPIVLDSRSVSSEKGTLEYNLEDTLKENDVGYDAKHRPLSDSTDKDSSRNVSQGVSGLNFSLPPIHSGSPATNNVTISMIADKNEVINRAFNLTTSTSTFQLSQSQANNKDNFLTVDNPIELASTVDEHCSSVGQTTHRESSQTLNTPHIGISSPILLLGDKISEPDGGYFSPGIDATSSSSSLIEKDRLQASISSTIQNSDEGCKLPSSKELVKNDDPYHNSQMELEGSRCINLQSHDCNTGMPKSLPSTIDQFSVEGAVSTDKHAFLDAYKLNPAVHTESTEFLLEGTPESPKNKSGHNIMQHSFGLKETVPSKLSDVPALRYNDPNCPNLQTGQKSLSAQTEISGKKRGTAHMLLADEDHLRGISRIQKSPKLFLDAAGNDSGDRSRCDVLQNNELGIGVQAPKKQWNDMLSKISTATERLLPPSVRKLNPERLDILDYIFGELQKARKYERLHSSLRNQNCSADLQKRVVEARCLLDKFVYEKARLQLNQINREQLANKAQVYGVKIEECANLKSAYSQFSALGAKTRHQGSYLHSDPDYSLCTRDQGANSGVTLMRQELEMLDGKMKCLMKLFGAFCNIKGNMSCDEITEIVNSHMKMKNCCRLIQQDLQLWKLSDVVKDHDQCDIVLDYCEVLFQRFTMHSRSVSNIVVNNVLKNDRIEKNFQKMNACVVFEFVFKAKGVRRITSLEQLSQETLETSLLLGTILDVLEEIRVSRIESWNLISSTFHLHGCQLDLLLSFQSFKSGRKVTLSLDLTSLNCATYPTMPSDVQIRILETQSSLPSSVFAEIMAAAEGLQSGRSMIVRLCRIISKLVQDSEGS